MSAWHYLVDQTTHGPVTEEDLRAALVGNQIAPDTFVWKEGMESWLPANQIPALSAQIDAAPVPLLPPEAQTPREPVHVEGTFPIVLVQQKFLRGKQTITIVDRGTVTYENRRGRPARHRRIDLPAMEAEPKVIDRRHYQSLLLIVPCAVLTLCVWLGVVMQTIAGQYASAGAVFLTSLFFALPAVALYFHMRANSGKMYSFAVKGGAPLDLWTDLPDAPIVSAFVAQLKELHAVRLAGLPAIPEVAPPKGCIACQSPDVVPGFATPLCGPCREKLIRTPFPIWLKAAMVIIGIMLGVAAFRLPHELSAATAYARGQSAEASGDFPGASSEYQKALTYYPQSPDVIRGLARAAFRAGDEPTALKYAQQLVSPTGEVQKDDLELISQIKGSKP